MFNPNPFRIQTVQKQLEVVPYAVNMEAAGRGSGMSNCPQNCPEAPAQWQTGDSKTPAIQKKKAYWLQQIKAAKAKHAKLSVTSGTLSINENKLLNAHKLRRDQTYIRVGKINHFPDASLIRLLLKGKNGQVKTVL